MCSTKSVYVDWTNHANEGHLLHIGLSLLKSFYSLIKTNPTTYGSINQGQ